jgi:hypothetical protein
MYKNQIHTKIAVRTASKDFSRLKQLAVSLGGAEEKLEESGVAALVMKDGTLLELYAAYASYPEYLFKNSNVVISFQVENLQKALSTALEHGLKDLTGIVTVCSTLQYCHLELPGGTVIGLYH